MRKYIVPSDEIPNAILNISIVLGLRWNPFMFIRPPRKPIMPRVTISGIILGKVAIKTIRHDMNMRYIIIEMSITANTTLSIRLVTKKSLPRKNIRLLPVNVSLYRWSAGNHDLVATE